MTPDVSVIIVSYNTRDLLRDCLVSLLAGRGLALEVFVVDNGSRDASDAMVEAEFPSVTLIRNPQNRGFAAANNVALPLTRGRHVLLLNPDTVVEPESVLGLASYLDGHPSAGMCGPLVLNSDGSFQSCGYRFPTLLSEVRQARNVGRLLRPLIGSEPPALAPNEAAPVEWIDGCCLMVRRAVVDQIGPLDEQYFLYAEELDWCFAARRHGWQIVANPDVRITHHRGQSSTQVSERSLALLVETRLRYYRKNNGLLTALVVSAVYAIGFAKQSRLEPQKNRAKLQGVTDWWRAMAGLSTSPPPRIGARSGA